MMVYIEEGIIMYFYTVGNTFNMASHYSEQDKQRWKLKVPFLFLFCLFLFISKALLTF